MATTAIITSVYFGVNFWKPIVLEQLEKDGNLRKDIKIDTQIIKEDQPKSWADLKQKWDAVVDPEKNFTPEDQRVLESLKTHLEKNKPAFEQEEKK